MLAILLGILVVLLALCTFLTQNLSIRGKAKIYILTIYTLGILIWPMLWKYLLKDNANSPVAQASLIWPIAILALEIYLLKYHTFEQELHSKRGFISMDANAVCTLTFALSSILGAQRDECCKNIFLYGVLGCIAFVMPSPQAPTETLENIIIEHSQKVFLTYSTGLLLAGSMLLIGNKQVNLQLE